MVNWLECLCSIDSRHTMAVVSAESSSIMHFLPFRVECARVTVRALFERQCLTEREREADRQRERERERERRRERERERERKRER